MLNFFIICFTTLPGTYNNAIFVTNIQPVFHDIDKLAVWMFCPFGFVFLF